MDVERTDAELWSQPEVMFPYAIGTLIHPRNFARDWHAAEDEARIQYLLG